MKRLLSFFTTVLTLLALVGYFEIVSAQGRGGNSGGRRGAPATVPGKPTTAGPPARPQGPPPIAERGAQGRGRSQTPPATPPGAAARGRGEGAGNVPPAAGGRGRGEGSGELPPAAAGRGRGEGLPPETAGRGSADGAEQVPVWARERRPPTAGELVAHNPQLAARLQTLLPGADLQSASTGFPNLGQFVAAVHVSNNLDIPFDQLKARMVGEKMSLGDAIQALRPDADADAAADRADEQARANMRDVRDN